MTVRWKAGDPNGIPSGYNGDDVPGDVKVPPCGLQDVDVAVFELFAKEIGFQVVDVKDQKKTTRPVPVIFGTGEKWAMNKKNAPYRDKGGTLILPLISIKRTGFDQNPEKDQRGRGVNQATGEVVFKRRLGPKDRQYQNLINSLGLVNQDNLPTGETGSPVASRRPLGENKFDADVTAGMLLALREGRHVWEFLTIPTPQFYTAKYEVTFWTQYTHHMNSLLERMLAAYLPQLPCLKVTTKPGYWFVAYVQGEYKSQDNFDEIVDTERVLKYQFTLEVPAYTVAPAQSGMPAPVRRYYSTPEITFEISGEKDVPKGSGNQGDVPVLDSADDPTLGYTLDGEAQPRPVGQRDKFYAQIVKNPFTGRERAKYVKVVSVNARRGESVFQPVDGELEFDLD